MAVELSEDDHDLLDAFLEKALNGYKSGARNLQEARLEIVEAFSLAAADNENFRNYMQASLDEEG